MSCETSQHARSVVVCQDETFDVTPYSKALSAFLLGHPDAQDFGRKFKIAFSGCEEHACGLASNARYRGGCCC